MALFQILQFCLIYVNSRVTDKSSNILYKLKLKSCYLTWVYGPSRGKCVKVSDDQDWPGNLKIRLKELPLSSLYACYTYTKQVIKFSYLQTRGVMISAFHGINIVAHCLLNLAPDLFLCGHPIRSYIINYLSSGRKCYVEQRTLQPAKHTCFLLRNNEDSVKVYM